MMVETNSIPKRFGPYGGQYVPETLMPALEEFEQAFLKYKDDPKFLEEFKYYLKDYVGRPTPLYHAKKLTAHYGKAKIYLKREDLNYTGAHKINNAIGQALLAKRLGKNEIIAETGAGQHGVATATACALLGMKAIVFMGAKDIERQAPNVQRMELLGAKIVAVHNGTATLKDATSEAIRYWISNVKSTHYIIGSVVGPAPYPTVVREFQKIIGEETKEQILEKESKMPEYIIACVGGGSNAIGIFHSFAEEEKKNPGKIELIGVEAAGLGLDTKEHSAPLCKGTPGVLHGSMGYLLQDQDGQIQEAHSISAGLDYPGVGPEHCYFKDAGIAEYVSVTDQEAIEAFKLLCKLEGLIPALESSHALAYLEKLMPNTKSSETVVVNLSGRGDKDLEQIRSSL